MTPIATALNYGYQASDIIKYLLKNMPDLSPKIQTAINAGYTPEQIVDYLKGSYPTSKRAKKEGYKSFGQRMALAPGMTESERQSLIRDQQQQGGVGGLLGSVSQAALPIAALGGTAAMASKLLGPLASAGVGALAGSLDQGQPNATGAQQQAQTAPQPQAPGANLGQGLAGLAKSIMGMFGFKSKPLVDAVSQIVKTTGEDVAKVYQDLSKKGDLSTPEKAIQAAQERLKELTGEGKVLSKEDIQSKVEAGEKLKTAQPIEQAKKQLAQSLKSSVIRRMNYDKENQHMDLIFNNGATYRYYDFPEKEWEALSEGGTPAKTSGKNEFGVWWVGKQPSRGATFNKIIQPHKKEAGPYKYEKIGNTPITEEELEELRGVQKPHMEKAEKLLSGEEKAQQASSALKKIPKKPLTEGQKVARSRILSKTIESIKAKPASERSKEAIQLIEDRLRTLEDLDNIARRKKTRVLDQEILRFEREQGQNLVKKLLTLFPKAVAKVIKDKIGSMDERSILEFMQQHLSRKK